MKNIELPNIGDTVLYEGEQYTIFDLDHESLIYGITNDDYEGFALLNELTKFEDVTTNSESSEPEPEQARAYFEPKNGDTLLS